MGEAIKYIIFQKLVIWGFFNLRQGYFPLLLVICLFPYFHPLGHGLHVNLEKKKYQL